MPERDERGRFIKGHAPNPKGGRPRLSPDEKQHIAELGRKGLDKLEAMMDDPETDAALQAKVAIFCVEKAYGKARQEADVSVSQEDAAPRIVLVREK